MDVGLLEGNEEKQAGPGRRKKNGPLRTPYAVNRGGSWKTTRRARKRVEKRIKRARLQREHASNPNRQTQKRKKILILCEKDEKKRGRGSAAFRNPKKMTKAKDRFIQKSTFSQGAQNLRR